MHELSIMTYLLEAVEKEAQQRGASKVLAINLRVGERAGIDDSLLFYFDLLTPETLCEGAKLNIQRTPMRFACQKCNNEYTPRGANFECPNCGTVGTLVDDASDLLIESLEIET
jgi:hydrogenase nickel incorporation protein HypA/HybF